MAASYAIAEKLVLVAWHDEKGKPAVANDLRGLTVGAVLIDLAIAERIRVEDQRVVVSDPAPTGHPVLDDVLERLAADGKRRKVRDWISKLQHRGRVREQVLDRLVEAGVLRRERHRFLGLIPITRHPVAQPTTVADLRRRLATNLATGDDLPPEEAGLGGLTAPLGRGFFRRLYDDRHRRRAAERRAKQLSKGEGIAGEVGDAIREAQAAAVAAVAAAGAVAATSGSSGGGS